MPLRSSFRHAFTRRLYAPDPITLPAIHRSSQATCRSSTSTTERTYEHNLALSRPRCSSAMVNHRAPGDAALARQRLLSSHSSGVGPNALTFDQPPQRPPKPPWIYPKPIDSDTSCRLLTPFTPRIRTANGDRADLGPSRPLAGPLEGSVRRARRAPEGAQLTLKGRLLLPLAKAAALDRTQGAFHLRNFFTGQPLRFRRRRPRSPARLPLRSTSK